MVMGMVALYCQINMHHDITIDRLDMYIIYVIPYVLTHLKGFANENTNSYQLKYIQ